MPGLEGEYQHQSWCLVRAKHRCSHALPLRGLSLQVTEEETETERSSATCSSPGPGSCEARHVAFRLQSPDSFMPSWWGWEGPGKGVPRAMREEGGTGAVSGVARARRGGTCGGSRLRRGGLAGGPKGEPGIPPGHSSVRCCKWRPCRSGQGFSCRLEAAERLCLPASLALGWVDRNESHPGPA